MSDILLEESLDIFSRKELVRDTISEQRKLGRKFLKEVIETNNDITDNTLTDVVRSNGTMMRFKLQLYYPGTDNAIIYHKDTGEIIKTYLCMFAVE
jgi:hypothetical protein